MISKRNCYFFVFVFFSSISLLLAESVVHFDGKDASAWQGMVLINRDIKRSGEGSYELFGKYPTEMISKEMFAIDPERTYTLSCWMRSLSEELPASAYMGLRLYDKDKKAINICHVASTPDSETSLLKEAKKGDKELLLAANPKWPDKVNGHIAFDCQSNYQDLPNFNLALIEQVERDKDGKTLRVLLKKALTRGYPPNTQVRLHSPYGAPFYWAAQGWMPAQWKHFTWELTGRATAGAGGSKFWPGTKYARFFIWFGNWDRIPQEGARLLVDDISFSSAPTKAVEITGALTMPRQWVLFGPLQENEAAEISGLRELPQSLSVGGRRLSPIVIPTSGDQIDLRKVYPSIEVKNAAYLFGTIEAAQDGKVTLGFGADWWMQVWIDGKLLCDTSSRGNVHWPPSPNDHCFQTDLTAGTHLLAVKLISGSGGATLKFAGPEQLRKLKAANKTP